MRRAFVLTPLAAALVMIGATAMPAAAAPPWERGVPPPVIDGGHLSLGAPQPAMQWYFAEGHTGRDFEEYVVVNNNGDDSASVTVSILGAGIRISRLLGPRSRATVNVKDLLPEGDAGVSVTADQPVVAERVQYFDYNGRTGGSSTVGSPVLSRTWTFAEGYTGPGFASFILLANPEPRATTAVVTFQPEGGAPVDVPVFVPADGRVSLNAADHVGAAGFTTRVVAEAGIVAERAMYFSYGAAVTGGHVALGARQASARWDFAEGHTNGFDTYYLLANPSGLPASVALTFRTGGGQTRTTSVFLGPGARHTVRANDVVPGGEAGATVESQNTVPIVAERAMYFAHPHWNGGTATLGAPILSSTWSFAEGYTAPEYESFVLVANPGNQGARGVLSLRRPDGTGSEVALDIPARSRAAVAVNGVPGFANSEFAASVATNQPVVAERMTYFRFVSTSFDVARLGDRTLSEGMSGPDVLETQRRMVQLGLDPGPVDGVFSDTSTHAAIAIEKWLGLPRVGDVGPEEKRFLAAGRPPQPRFGAGNRIEIDISRQLGLWVRDGQVIGWWPASTGRADNTPRGQYHIYRKDPGWGCGDLGCLWNGIYFVGGYAIHGYPSVPPFPASAGCARAPMVMADWIFDATPVGYEVQVYD